MMNTEQESDLPKEEASFDYHLHAMGDPGLDNPLLIEDHWLPGKPWGFPPTYPTLLSSSLHRMALEEEEFGDLGAIMVAAVSGEGTDTIHALKTWPAEFQAIARGEKAFDLRANDRNFKVGDVLVLREYDPDTTSYTGEVMVARVSYILPGGSWELPEHLCIMSIKVSPFTLAIISVDEEDQEEKKEGPCDR